MPAWAVVIWILSLLAWTCAFGLMIFASVKRGLCGCGRVFALRTSIVSAILGAGVGVIGAFPVAFRWSLAALGVQIVLIMTWGKVMRHWAFKRMVKRNSIYNRAVRIDDAARYEAQLNIIAKRMGLPLEVVRRMMQHGAKGYVVITYDPNVQHHDPNTEET